MTPPKKMMLSRSTTADLDAATELAALHKAASGIPAPTNMSMKESLPPPTIAAPVAAHESLLHRPTAMPASYAHPSLQPMMPQDAAALTMGYPSSHLAMQLREQAHARAALAAATAPGAAPAHVGSSLLVIPAAYVLAPESQTGLDPSAFMSPFLGGAVRHPGLASHFPGTYMQQPIAKSLVDIKAYQALYEQRLASLQQASLSRSHACAVPTFVEPAYVPSMATRVAAEADRQHASMALYEAQMRQKDCHDMLMARSFGALPPHQRPLASSLAHRLQAKAAADELESAKPQTTAPTGSNEAKHLVGKHEITPAAPTTLVGKIIRTTTNNNAVKDDVTMSSEEGSHSDDKSLMVDTAERSQPHTASHTSPSAASPNMTSCHTPSVVSSSSTKTNKKKNSNNARKAATAKAAASSSDDKSQTTIPTKYMEQWELKLKDLREYRNKYGHCNVPQAYGDKVLAGWVKTQRYQFKLRQAGKQSPITDERISKLKELGFDWNPRPGREQVVWLKQYRSLVDYYNIHGTASVPQKSGTYRKLGLWVTNQRRQYRKLAEGVKSHMTKERIRLLDDLNFQWNPMVARGD